jgi:hypothetical protein
MPDTSELRRTAESVKARVADAGDTVRAHVNDTVDQVSRAAADATDAMRQHGARMAENAQAFYDDIEGDTPGDKLRSLVADYPVAALLIAGAAGYLIGRVLHDRSGRG